MNYSGEAKMPAETLGEAEWKIELDRLFQALYAEVTVEQPDDVLTFLIEQLENSEFSPKK